MFNAGCWVLDVPPFLNAPSPRPFLPKVPRRRGGAGMRAAWLWHPRRQQRQARCLPKFRAAAGGDPDGVPGPCAGAGGTAGHAADRIDGQRSGRHGVAALRVHRGPVHHHRRVQGGHGRVPRPSDAGRTARGDRGRIAQQRQTAAHDAADLLDHGPAQDRPRFGQVDAYGAADLCGLDAEAAAAVGAGSGEMQHLRRRSAPAADSGAAGPAAGL